MPAAFIDLRVRSFDNGHWGPPSWTGSHRPKAEGLSSPKQPPDVELESIGWRVNRPIFSSYHLTIRIRPIHNTAGAKMFKPTTVN